MVARKIIFFAFVLFFNGVSGGASTITPHTSTSLYSHPEFSAISQLQNHVDGKFNELKRDITSNSRNLEHQNRITQAAANGCKNDIDRLIERTRRFANNQNSRGRNDGNLEEKLEDLSKKLQVTLATLRLITEDLETIKQNFTKVANVTSTIWEKMEVESSIQNIFDPPLVQRQKSNPKPSQELPRSCEEIKEQNPASPSSIYLVQPAASKSPFLVFCDMVVQDGGWLTIHNRYNGHQDFQLAWEDYKNGFGNIAGEYWLGLEKIHQLTGNNLNELLIEVVDPNKIQSFAHYDFFSIGPEDEGYPLKVLGGYKGNAGDYFSYHAGSKFTTKEKDQDSWEEGNCARSHGGAWWYKSCDQSNLNGKYIPMQLPDQLQYQAMYWGGTSGSKVGLLQARMLIRPLKDFNSGVTPVST